MRKVVVVGGGITGLAAAHRLIELDSTLEVLLLEAGDRLGGVLETRHRDGFLVEASADNFITNVPWAVDLCRRIGLGNELLQTDESRRRAYVVRHCRLHAVPDGFTLMAPARLWPILTTRLLSPWGKLRLAAERFIAPRREITDESLASFARRRLGREVFERLVQPLVSGIYTADPERLSAQAALPRFVEMEHKYSSLIRGALAERRMRGSAADTESGARYALFAAPREGMSSLVDALAARLPHDAVCLNTRVERFGRTSGGGWSIATRSADGGSGDEIAADAVVVALPAPQASAVLVEVDRELADELGEISYAGCAIALLAYRREQFAAPLDGFGFVVPEIERRQILACSYASEKFPGRAPPDCVLLRVFLGGACHPEVEQLPDEALRRITTDEMRSLLHVRGEPLWCEIQRWHGAMPQYHVGHVERVARIFARAAALEGLELAGNAYHGVGVPNCIRSGEAAAERIMRPSRG